VFWWLGDYWRTRDVNDIVPVQDMPKGPGNGVDSELANALSAACPDRAAGSLLADGVHPQNKHQDTTVICNNHASSTKHHELVSKAHREENAAGRNVFLRPTGAFRAW
jgi:hypothetical protein